MKKLFTLLVLILSAVSVGAQDNVLPYRQTIKENHDMRVINSGTASLYARVDMIRRAKKTVDLESYIFSTDTAGKLILQELAKAAERGVKVRILVDKYGSKVDPFVADELRMRGIELKYYNPSSILSFNTYQFRNHRKLLIRDGEEAMTGGRNIADEYFDLSESFNFLDRDISVEGPIVATMDKSFENFFNSSMSEKPDPPRFRVTGSGRDRNSERAQFEQKKSWAARFFDPDPKVQEILQLLGEIGKETLEATPKRICPEVTFASDREGAGHSESKKEGYRKEYRYVGYEIEEWIKEKPQEELVIDTPYFLQSLVTERLMAILERKKVKVRVFTNSLASTDAIHVSTVFSDFVGKMTPLENFSAYVYKGKYSGESKVKGKPREAGWGTHSKSMIFGPDSFMIGSFNVDNRSSNLNTELAIFCSGAPELTKDVKDNVEQRIKNSIPLNPNSGEECDIYGDSGPVKRFLYYLLKIPSHMIEDLL